MSQLSTNTSAAMAGTSAQARTWWHARAPRERLALGAAAALIGAFLFWAILIAPAWRAARAAPAEIDRLEMQLQTMQALANESKSLRGAPTVSSAQAVEALKIATGRLGDKASIAFQGDRATLTLNGVAPDALREWLDEARAAAHARPIDVQLARTPQGQSGIVVVSL